MDLPLYWTALIAFLIINAMLLTASVLVYAERKISGFIQHRLGPNRVGPAGFLQPFADVVKLLFKEDIIPAQANRFIHALAPTIMVTIAMTVPALIPFARGVVIADIDVGVLAILALTSISVYGITLAGWSSNSKYSLLGGLRSSAQMISYELAMGTAVLSVILQAGSLNVSAIVEAQRDGWAILGWHVFTNPIGALIFIVTAFAETNRLPFDLPEAEQELVGGYHTEYSGMKFGMFFLAEYVNLFVASFVIATLFFGGYLVPFEPLLLKAFPALEGSVLLGLLQFLSLLAKTCFFAFLYIWVRWTFPRFKYNQLMTLGWKYLLPIGLANVILIALGVALFS
jgi:NADH-quinone oxidoreductase subunit H|uniref:NADH-quinone oxidoreductase subunit 8 n=1 Tax=Rhodothermus marinus TaxID=29549 RepID=NQO8_RHOMR|nr:RecName: Full=NADH-quinone oxidoreductase subunit 8; AltName: Full=NADH dehydrogenase I subunit 8; AltName: Full=NDH-1 subunit 8 [Rhodothermus marinus]AAY42992.1 Nqo8 [Rhodothermus marinus]